MAMIETWFNQDLQEPVQVRYLDGNVFSQDNQGNLIGVNVFNGGAPASLSGAVSASCIRPDGNTVAVVGVLTGSSVYVLLPSAAYAVPGPLSVVVKLTGGGSTTTLCAVIANVYQSSTDTVVDPGTILPSISELIAEIEEAVGSIPLDYTALWREVDDSYSDSIAQFSPFDVPDLVMGKTLSNGVYTDAASAVASMRAATATYYKCGNYLKIIPLSGYKVEVDFYDDNKSYISYVGWITSETILKPLGKYFRIIVGGDSDISSVYQTIATVSRQSNLFDTNRRTDELNKMCGGTANFGAWIVGKFPNFNTDEIWSNSEYKYSPKVRIIGGARYFYTGILNSVCGIIFYDKNGAVIPGASTNENEFIAPDNAVYADIGTRYVDTNPVLIIESSEHVRELSVTEVSGVITTGLVVNPENIGARVDMTVEPLEKYLVSGYCYAQGIYPIVIFLNGNTLVSYNNLAEGYSYDAPVVVPYGANRMIVNGKPREIRIKREYITVTGAEEYLTRQQDILWNYKGKKIVWFGTSIPAGGWFGYEHPNSYPQQVGRLLGADVINEAIGSSCVHCKDPTRISEDNPYGFKGGFESTSRCLSNSLEEAEWIIDHWNSDIWTSGVPSEMSEWLKDKIRSFGYERKLDQYLTPSTFPDLFVFDHGYNDSSDTNNYYETYGRYNLYTFRGAMNFLIKRILDYNPEANIIIIGNYTTTRDVPQMQETVAKDWAIPICKQWENLGLSQTEYVTCSGYWSLNNGVYEWISDNTERTYTVKDRLIPDGIHPHSNPDGIVEKKMAEYIAKWMLANVPKY